MSIESESDKILSSADDEILYDENIKRLLGDKSVLARILKGYVFECKDMSYDEIETCIEGTPEINKRPVDPGMSNSPHITGMNTEDKVPFEGAVYYDVYFYILLPGAEKIKIIIDLEAQKRKKQTYDLSERGIFYCARMLSAEQGREFYHSEYQKLKKVYSIWIAVTDDPNEQNTAVEYTITEKNLVGHLANPGRYDLMTVVIINVSDESIVNAKEGDPLALHRFIEAIIGKLDVKDKIRILQDEYGIRMTSGMEGRLMNMCNLSSSLVEKGLERGIEQGIQKTQRETVLRMNDRGYDISTISDLTGLPLTDVKRIIEENQ